MQDSKKRTAVKLMKTRLFSLRLSAMNRRLCGSVYCQQFGQEIMQLIQPQRVGPVRFCLGWIVMNFHKNAVDPGGHCGPRQQWNKFRLPSGDCLPVSSCGRKLD